MKINLPKDAEKFRLDYETGYKHGYEACKKEIEEKQQQDFEQELSFIWPTDDSFEQVDWSQWITQEYGPMASQTYVPALDDKPVGEKKFKEALDAFQKEFELGTFTYNIAIDPNTFHYIGDLLLSARDDNDQLWSTTGTLRFSPESLEDDSVPTILSMIETYVSDNMKPYIEKRIKGE